MTEITLSKVWVLQHECEIEDGYDDVKFIGVYSFEKAAKDAIARLSDQPGFRDFVDGFHIDAYEIDKDHWTEGFVRVP